MNQRTDALLNDFATRSFRDTADLDYIAARLCYKNSLYPQFHWQALQAIEKYFKAIFLYNRIKAKNVNHDLSAALKLSKKLPFKMDLSQSTMEFIEHLNNYGRYRYLEISYEIMGHKLVELDKAIWEIRRYCKVLDYKQKMPDGTIKNMLELELERIERASKEPFYKYHIIGGELEKIIAKKDHPSRSALIWQNVFFTTRHRKYVKSYSSMHAVNSPLYLNPELIDEVIKYVYLPKPVIEAFQRVNKSSKRDAVTRAPS
ncbi:HEPN domain-containing protein [Endozoicomonas sp. 4G]|uniref:HEPN domain-containing protein n=1 Tax=Endozoicomonas sp. 4G TaxID=2872754 RepID=UPI002078E60D|nr:HEPN domain-containing protein [Endozoicomonas sp. 4G]